MKTFQSLTALLALTLASQSFAQSTRPAEEVIEVRITVDKCLRANDPDSAHMEQLVVKRFTLKKRDFDANGKVVRRFASPQGTLSVLLMKFNLNFEKRFAAHVNFKPSWSSRVQNSVVGIKEIPKASFVSTAGSCAQPSDVGNAMIGIELDYSDSEVLR